MERVSNKLINTTYTDDKIESIVNMLESEQRCRLSKDLKEFKKYTHLCQYIGYKGIRNENNPGKSTKYSVEDEKDREEKEYEQATQRARKCFEPYLLFRRHYSTILSQHRGKLDECVFNARKMGKPDSQVRHCFQIYKKDMDSCLPTIHTLLNGYLKNLTNDKQLQLSNLDNNIVL